MLHIGGHLINENKSKYNRVFRFDKQIIFYNDNFLTENKLLTTKAYKYVVLVLVTG